MISRRQALKNTLLTGAALAVIPSAMGQTPSPAPTATLPAPFQLPSLPYAVDALEPHIDAQTMQIHHDRHHAAYVNNLNAAVAKLPPGASPTLESLLTGLAGLPENVRNAIRNNGGGHFNHSLFWQMMAPKGGGTPTGELGKAIDTAFGNFGAFKEGFTKAALGQFGSGWAWLVLDGKQLKIEGSPNQDTPLSAGRTPLLGLDVWEHAYYLKYQNKRADYIAAWFNVVNWDFAAERYAKANG